MFIIILKQPKKYWGFYHGTSVGAFYTQVFTNVDKFQFGVLNLGLKFKIIVTQN
jgi:hypothetical protein